MVAGYLGHWSARAQNMEYGVHGHYHGNVILVLVE